MMPDNLVSFVSRMASGRIRRPRGVWYDYDGVAHPRPHYDEWDDPDRSDYPAGHLSGTCASADIGWTDVHNHDLVSLRAAPDTNTYWFYCKKCKCIYGVPVVNPQRCTPFDCICPLESL